MLNKKASALLLILISVSFMPIINTQKIKATAPTPFFTIYLLCPKGQPDRTGWVTRISKELQQIGIGTTLILASWVEISPRTWSYPGPYPIPSYAEGGYDILFVGWSGRLDFNPTGLFDSPSITPNGDNFYQYENPEMDWAISNYSSSFVFDDRIYWAKQIQAILYDDLPRATIFYPADIYPHDPNLVGWDPLLWELDFQSMENWSISHQTKFHYATRYQFKHFHIYDGLMSENDAQWLHQIYTGLIERDSLNGYDYSPRLATSITTTDGYTYNIELNPNATWADGTPLNAYDVNFSYNVIFNADFGVPYYHKDWWMYVNESSVQWDPAISNYTLSITFEKRDVFQKKYLALDILPKHIWETIPYANLSTQAEIWAKTDPGKIFGAGPYRLASYNETNQIIHLIKNEYFDEWYGSEPYFDEVYFEYFNYIDALDAISSGIVDMIDHAFPFQPDQLPPAVSYTMVDKLGLQEMAFNNKHPYIGTGEFCPISGPESAKHVRKAINHAIPREAIIEDVLNDLGTPGVTGFPKTAIDFDHTLKPYEYNLTLARQHMESAGFVYEDTLTTLSIGETSIAFLTIMGSLVITATVNIIVRIKKQRKSIF
ncbi:MAG: hypothetical protein DRP02_02590 [Candidatus Gerdarchaeota archaeon]|nr:MAG: hypothetical protein DRO63_04405 [Candidatus Gerdarchaeota archaeon]RLI72130.1 MAG: hypothetical protein DRP02_02590 [Candidatus Gerdarchaeota archaeon]